MAVGVKRTMQFREESVVLSLPSTTLKDPHHSKVFFNERMRFNRTLSSLAVGAAYLLDFTEGVLCDGLSASGARGLRYALENDLKKTVFVDANPDAIKFLKKNVSFNKLGKRAKIVCADFNSFLASSKQKFGFLEIDPFGSPTPFIENSFRALDDKAILSVTATDLASSAGTRPAAARRHYDAKPLKTEYAHETALRLLVGKVARVGASLDYGVTPLFSFYYEHAVKTVCSCEKSALKADESLKKIGFVSHCFKCLRRATGFKESCGGCGGRNAVAGPLWIGDLSEKSFVQEMLALNEERRYADEDKARRLLELIEGEQGFPPWFFDLHFVCKKIGVQAKKNDFVIKSLEKKGFRASRTHFCGQGIKSSAEISKFINVLS